MLRRKFLYEPSKNNSKSMLVLKLKLLEKRIAFLKENPNFKQIFEYLSFHFKPKRYTEKKYAYVSYLYEIYQMYERKEFSKIQSKLKENKKLTKLFSVIVLSDLYLQLIRKCLDIDSQMEGEKYEKAANDIMNADFIILYDGAGKKKKNFFFVIQKKKKKL